MTNKLFIVKYVFIVDVDKNKNKNFDTNFDKRESFDDTSFNINVAQNICFLDVANDVNSLELNVASKVEIVNEIKKV